LVKDLGNVQKSEFGFCDVVWSALDVLLGSGILGLEDMDVYFREEVQNDR